MTRKEFMDKFFDLCKDAQEELPPNVIAEILRDYADRLELDENDDEHARETTNFQELAYQHYA